MVDTIAFFHQDATDKIYKKEDFIRTILCLHLANYMLICFKF